MDYIQLIQERLVELEKLKAKASEKFRDQDVREIESLIKTNISMLRGLSSTNNNLILKTYDNYRKDTV